MCADNLAGKALGTLLIGTSDAKAPKVSDEFLARCPQICGQFGYTSKHAFDITFTKNPKGGMNSDAHRDWAQVCL
jgi:hypothetical protein